MRTAAFPAAACRASRFSVRIAVLLAAVTPPAGMAKSISDLQAAVAAVPPGGTLRLPAGLYRGPLRIERPLTLEASGGAVIDGGGSDNVITVDAPGVVLRGLVVRHSGTAIDRSNAGIVLNAPRAVVEDCALEDVLFGVFATGASDTLIRHNTIRGLPLGLGRRGDGVSLWECQRCEIEGNTISQVRDTVIWYSNRVVLRDNRIHGNRYGMHFMFSDHCDAEDNRIEDNSVGIYLMYSRALTLRRNVVGGNRGPSGYGLGLKDVDGVEAEGNLFVANRIGIHIENSPSRTDLVHHFRGNTIAYNEVGLAFLPNVTNNEFSGNAFIDNTEQIAIEGGGRFEGDRFTAGGRGNYWSDYQGYDRDRDGIGDVPYRARGFFEDLMDREPELRLFLGSPAQRAVETAVRAFPLFPPRLKAVDTAPLMEAPAAAFAADAGRRGARPVWIAAAACLTVFGAVLALAAPPSGARPPSPRGSRS